MDLCPLFLGLNFKKYNWRIFSVILATVLHLVLVEPRLKDNMDTYYPLVKSVLVITIIDALILDTFSFIFNFISGNVDFAVFYFFMLVPMITCILAVSLDIMIAKLII